MRHLYKAKIKWGIVIQQWIWKTYQRRITLFVTLSPSKSNDLNLYVLFIISIYKGELYH